MKQERNSIMRGASGALGNELVFRQRGGRTIISLPPLIGPDNPTEDQQTIRERFKEAIRYAKLAIANADLKAAYQAKTEAGSSAYNTAFADSFRAPVIMAIDVSNYSGSPGNTIRIVATDDFRVEAVRVTILNATGEILEEGAAVASPEGEDAWIYTTTATNATPAGGKVSVQVSDLPANVTTQELAFVS